MKDKNILNAMGGIDDDMILDAAPAEKKKMRLPWGRIGAAAACAAVVLAGAFAVAPYLADVDPVGTTSDLTYNETTAATSPAMSKKYRFAVSRGIFSSAATEETSNMRAEEHMRIIEDERYASYQSARVIDETYVGEKLEEVEVKVYWYHYADDSMTDIEYLTAEVYKIKGVDPGIAFCIKYLDPCDTLTTTHYYTFINHDVRFDSLAEFFTLYHAEEYFSVRTRTYVDALTTGTLNDTTYDLSESEAASLTDILLSCDGVKKTLTEDVYNEILNSSKKQMRLRFDLASWGIANYSMFITDSGHLLFVWYGETVYFDIGKENAAAIIDFVCDSGEIYTYAEDGTVMETTRQ